MNRLFRYRRRETRQTFEWKVPAAYPENLVNAREVAKYYFRQNYQRFWDRPKHRKYLRRAHMLAGLLCLAGAALCLAGLVALIWNMPWHLSTAVQYMIGTALLTGVLITVLLFDLADVSHCGPSDEEKQETWLDAHAGSRTSWMVLWRDARIYCGEASTNVFRLGFAKNRWAFVLVPAGLLLSVVPVVALPWEGFFLSAAFAVLSGCLWLVWWRAHFLFYDAEPGSKAPDDYLPLRVMLSDIKILLDLPD
ncbi:hypothetical protein JKG47_01015 [Acidithiobacillus sp. MC6.1]|nr:hypothetical protein [Acidithiobacillus sp. MC6.1]